MAESAPPEPAWRIGVDIGGTFTDFCAFDEASGALRTLKVLSTPDRPGEEVIAGLRALQSRHGVEPGRVEGFTHGTTVGVNTVIQRRGIRLCLFVTAGFEDVLEVARLKMPDPYDLFSRRPPPLVGRDLVFPIAERILVDGSVETVLDEDSVRAALAGARAAGAEGVVVALLHAYRNPEHERRIAELLRREAPELSVTLASQVWPVIREYERTVTATVAGYVQRRVAGYLGSLQRALRAAGVPAEPMITKSNGGVMTAELGKTECAQMLLSGTASGVIGAAAVAGEIGAAEAMSLDIGGTSADVAIIRGGAPQYGVGEMIGDFPIYIPTVSVTSIGDGGGSIAWVDSHGVLKVGPESAGSEPGPACYGRGGDRPTITDAFAVCGFLGHSELGYSAVSMQPDLAARAVGGLAGRMGLGLQETAAAIIRVAVSGMYLEVSKLVSRHGIDPRELSLIAFGGAGPMLACFLARELGMRNVVVPLVPGVLSAFGGLIADIKNDFIQTVYLDLDEAGLAAARRGFEALRCRATAWLREEQGYRGPATLLHSADMRYRGQSWEIDTPLQAGWIDAGDGEAIAGAFHARHRQTYGHADPSAPAQIINLRMVVTGTPPKPDLPGIPAADRPVEPRGTARVWQDGAWRPAAVLARRDLRAGHRFRGPAIVTQDDCTVCVLEGFAASIDARGNLVLAREG